MSTTEEQPPGDSQIARWRARIGYGEPPVHTRFPKGKSGNPGGRPRGITAGRAANLILDELYRFITVREGGKARRMATLRAIIRGQVAAAAKGNTRTQRELIALALSIEQRQAAQAATAEAADTRECTDMDLARWILSVLEGAAAQADKDAEKEKEAKSRQR